VSDDRIKGYRDGMKLTELWEAVPMTGSEVRRIYEADRLKTREVVQALCNALEGTKTNPSWWREHPSESWIHDAMESAKELGIVPKK
jgi:hypothetical protein